MGTSIRWGCFHLGQGLAQLTSTQGPGWRSFQSTYSFLLLNSKANHMVGLKSLSKGLRNTTTLETHVVLKKNALFLPVTNLLLRHGDVVTMPSAGCEPASGSSPQSHWEKDESGERHIITWFQSESEKFIGLKPSQKKPTNRMRSSIVLCLKKTSVFFENPNLGSTWLKPISPFHIWCHDSMIRLAFLAHFKCGEALRFTIGSRAELSVSQGAASAKRCRWFRTKSKNPARSMNFLHEYIHPVYLQSFLASFESWKFLESICICFQGQHPACRSRRHHAKWGRRPSVSGLPKQKNAVGWNHVGRCWIYIFPCWSILWMLSFYLPHVQKMSLYYIGWDYLRSYPRYGANTKPTSKRGLLNPPTSPVTHRQTSARWGQSQFLPGSFWMGCLMSLGGIRYFPQNILCTTCLRPQIMEFHGSGCFFS